MEKKHESLSIPGRLTGSLLLPTKAESIKAYAAAEVSQDNVSEQVKTTTISERGEEEKKNISEIQEEKKLITN